MSPGRRLLSSLFTAALVACVAMTQACMPAWAYRPFDGTDAAVAAPGELEIEFQPAGSLRQGSDKTLIAPATVVNIGLPDRWEAVFQGQGQFPLPGSDQPAAFTGAGAFLKHVLRPGSLQNENGPSIATEFGALLPGINADAGFGASVAGIVSQRLIGSWNSKAASKARFASGSQTRHHCAGLSIAPIQILIELDEICRKQKAFLRRPSKGVKCLAM